MGNTSRKDNVSREAKDIPGPGNYDSPIRMGTDSKMVGI